MRHQLLLVLAPFLAGCSSSGGSIAAPSYDPAAIAQAALNSLDKNKNGQVEGAELDGCQALKRALPAIDRNGDKSLSASEITQRVELYAKQGFVSLTCTVTLDSQPLSGATVVFEPETFMASLKTATTLTDKDGVSGTLEMDGKPLTALPAGLYRIKITKAGTTIPGRFNTETTLGREVINDDRQGGATIELALSSR